MYIRFYHRLLACLTLCLTVSACSTLPDNFEKDDSWSYPVPDQATYPFKYSDAVEANPGRSGVVLVSNGVDAFAARLAMVSQAVSTIDSQYYLFHNDQTGQLFARQLLMAANRGVRVRLLVDDMDQGGRDFSAVVLDAHPNIEVRVFNPFSRNTPRLFQMVTRFGDVTRRMHNKTLTVDERISILGGRNIGDEYFDASDATNFTDLDSLVIGPVVRQVAASFDAYWNNDLSYPITTISDREVSDRKAKKILNSFENARNNEIDAEYLKAISKSEYWSLFLDEGINFKFAEIRAVYDKPEKFESNDEKFYLAADLKETFKAVKSSLVIISPYFVPGKIGTAFLTSLARSGIRVQILTNSLSSTDVAIVHSGYIRYRKKLLEAGVEIHEVQSDSVKPHLGNWAGSSSASLHSKAFIFDHSEVFVGSLNLDPRSVYENSEIGLLIQSSEVAGDLADWYDEFASQSSYEVFLQDSWTGARLTRWRSPSDTDGHVIKNEPDSSIFRRATINFFRFLPIESQL